MGGAQRKEIDAQTAQGLKILGQSHAAAMTATQEETDAKLAAIAKQASAASAAAQVMHDAEEKRLADDLASSIEAGQTDLAAKKKALADFRATAKAEADKKAADPSTLPLRPLPSVPTAGDFDAIQKRTFSVAGTFNANGVAGLSSSGNAASRTATATEKANELLKSIENATKQVGKAIGGALSFT